VSAGFDPPRGTDDLLPPESDRIEALAAAAGHTARLFGFRPVETPSLDHTEVFARTSGESSDVVTKEMYTFEDRAGRSLTLKPEGTASVVRAYLRHRHELPLPFRGYYVERTWRYGRPQSGRLREFRQFGVEILGTDAPEADVEVIAVGDRYLRDHGLERLDLRLNTIGDGACRPAYRDALLAYLRDHREELTDEHRDGFERNPLRVLDCKDAGCRAVAGGAPLITDFLCEPCAAHHAAVKAGLDAWSIGYTEDPRLVRGLDYYTRTAFEFESDVLSEAQATVCGGGRYDGLAEVLGGDRTPGVGFGMGLERVLMAMGKEGVPLPVARGAACYVVAVGRGREAAWTLVRALRAAGVAAETTLGERPLKAQLRAADRAGAVYAAIVGDREADAGVVTMRRLSDGEQQAVPREEVTAWLASRA